LQDVDERTLLKRPSSKAREDQAEERAAKKPRLSSISEDSADLSAMEASTAESDSKEDLGYFHISFYQN
jgi:hypothetical protein